MNVLKGITRELRGHDETRGNEGAQTKNSEVDRARRESTDNADESPTEGSDVDSSARCGDEHLCPFCQTAFDANRGSCPECDAEIVLRGAR